MLLDSNACISELFFSFVYLLQCPFSQVAYIYIFFFLHSEGGHGVITRWHKVRNGIYLFILEWAFIFIFFLVASVVSRLI